MTLLYFITFAISLLFSLILTWFVRNLAMGRGWVAPPLQERDLHETPLPRLGGVSIFLSFLISLGIAFGIALLASRHFPGLVSGPFLQVLLTILAPGTVVFLLGIYDDIYSVGPYTKFAVQAVAAIMLFAGGLRILDLPVLFGARHLPWPIGLPITVFSGSSLVSLLTIALAGAILGFLRFNFNPATIFLGDCGSLFVGFMLSALALAGAQKAPTAIAVAIPVVSFGLPILETTLSVVRRFIGGRPVFTADREHIHHKLLQSGMSPRQVVIVLYAVSGLFALLSLFLLWPAGHTLGLVLAVLGTGIWFGVQRLGYLEFGEIRRVAQRTMEQRGIFVNNLSIRRAIEELKGVRDYAGLCHILKSAFSTNDFDGFELSVKAQVEEHPMVGDTELRVASKESLHFEWKKPGPSKFRNNSGAWHLTLELMTSQSRWHGSIRIYRLYSNRALLVDTNLLTSVFPVVLADAVERVLASKESAVPEVTESTEFIAAEAS